MNIKTQIDKCSKINPTVAKIFTVLLAVVTFMLLSVLEYVIQKDTPVLLLTFATFGGSCVAWAVSKKSDS